MPQKYEMNAYSVFYHHKQNGCQSHTCACLPTCHLVAKRWTIIVIGSAEALSVFICPGGGMTVFVFPWTCNLSPKCEHLMYLYTVFLLYCLSKVFHFYSRGGINELRNLQYLPRSSEPREILLEDRTRCHADHVGQGFERITTAAVGIVKAIHCGQGYVLFNSFHTDPVFSR